MIKINYLSPFENESPDDIAIHNIKISDKFKKPDLLEASCISWLQIDKLRDYQDLEQLLRYLQVESHLIAQPTQTIPEGFELKYCSSYLVESESGNQTQNQTQYILKISPKSKEEAIKEILSYHSSYEENFDCLKKTGSLVSKQLLEQENKESDLTNTDKVLDEIKKVPEAKVKLDISFYKPEESVNLLISTMTIQYGKTPEQILYGEINGNKVYALAINNQIISPIGWIKKESKIIKSSNPKISIEYDTNLSNTNTESKIQKIYSSPVQESSVGIGEGVGGVGEVEGIEEENKVEYELIDFRSINFSKR